MLSGIKKNIRKNYLLKAYQSANRQVCFPTLNKIKKVGFINALGSPIPFNHPFIGQFEITCLNISPDKRPKENHDQTLYKSDSNWIGLPKTQNIDWFVNSTFDLLIDFTAENNDTIEYICAKSLAKFKIAMNKESRVYDLVIKKSGIDFNTFLNEINETILRFNSNK